MTVPTRTEIHIETWSIIKVVLIVLAAIFLYVVRDVIVILLFSIVIASAVDPAVSWITRRGLPRTLATFCVYIILFLFLALILFVIIRPLASELGDLSEQLPQYFDRISLTFEEVQGSPAYEEALSRVRSYLGEMSSSLASIASNVFTAITRLFGGLVSAVAVIVISFYLTAQERGISTFIKSFVPAAHEEHVTRLWLAAQKKMGRWLRGQIILSLSVGLLVFIGLTIFGIRYSLLLALLAALFEIIPFVGPILAAIPAIIIALLNSPAVALWTILIYVIVQQLENTILAPKIMERVVGLNPVVVTVPVAAVIVEIMRDSRRERQKRIAGDSPLPV